MKASEIWPEGRTLYYEGDDPVGFIKKMAADGLEAQLTVTIQVPGERIDEFYEGGKHADERMGS